MMDIPLVDRSLRLSVYQIHNFPVTEPGIKSALSYKLEANFVAMTDDQKYVALLEEGDMIKCGLVGSNICRLQTPLYPVKHSEYCVVALMMNFRRKIDKFCLLNRKAQFHNLAHHVRGPYWAISALKPDNLKMNCREREFTKEVEPGWELMEIPNGCSVFSDHFQIPAYEVLTKRRDRMAQNTFLDFNMTKAKVRDFRLIKDLPVHGKTDEEYAHIVSQLPELKDVTKGRVIEKLKQIDENYPVDTPMWIYILIAVVVTIVGSLKMVVCCVCCYYCHKKQKTKVEIKTDTNLERGRTPKTTPTTLRSPPRGFPAVRNILTGGSSSEGELPPPPPEARGPPLSDVEPSPGPTLSSFMTSRRSSGSKSLRRMREPAAARRAQGDFEMLPMGTPSSAKVTPQGVRRALEQAGVDLTKYDKKKKQRSQGNSSQEEDETKL